MDDQKLKDVLEQLQAEMQHTENLDEKGRELLRQIEADLQELLKRSGKKPGQVQSGLLQRFEDTIDHLEATHPVLAGTLTELMEILSKAGI